MYRYKITFAYDGTNFSGFQIQPNKRTVEQTLKNAVNKIAKNPEPPLSVIGSGRTDAGVHALNQVAHFDCPYKLGNDSMRKALNSLLPLDIIVDQSDFVNPFKRNYTAHFKYPVDVAKMQKAAQDLVGEHDFTSFVASGSQALSNVRTIYQADVHRDEANNEIVFDFVGNGFLYNQVRIMVAFLLEIGSNQRPVDDVIRVLATKDRNQARMTAPASGLYLVSVDYGDQNNKTIDESESIK